MAKGESGAIEKTGESRLTGTFHDGAAIDARLMHAQKNYHLCSPFTAAGALPEGCAVQICLVKVDVESETYPTGGGKRGLGKNALDRISHAVGLSWDPRESRRIDDGSDPYYCHYKAVGYYRASDGQRQTVQDEKEFDVRDGSPQLVGKTVKQIAEMRAHVLSHAITKARLRAIRSMGVATGYSAADLQKPFACARVVFTGQSADPELRRDFARATAASFLGGVTSLYGEQTGQARQFPASSGHAPPPVSAVSDDDPWIGRGDGDDDPNVIEHEPAPARAAEQARPVTGRSDASPAGDDEPEVRFGRDAGTPLSEASERTLDWYGGALRKSIADPDKARFRSSNEADLAGVERELARRNGTEAEPPAEHDAGDDFPEGW
jgi:hypothetical protein